MVGGVVNSSSAGVQQGETQGWGVGQDAERWAKRSNVSSVKSVEREPSREAAARHWQRRAGQQ